MIDMPFLTRTRTADRHLGMMRRAWPVAASLQMLMAASSAFAQPTSMPPVQPAPTDTNAEAEQESPVGKGDATRAWLGAQASRKQASATRQTLSGPVLSAVHERYVKSFAQPVEPTPIRADMPPSSR
jgi:hypothetical protein